MEGTAIDLIVSGIWGVGKIVGFVVAIRFYDAIEAGSSEPSSAVCHWPRSASVLPVAVNIGVTQDAEIQVMRLRMNRIPLLIMVGFVIYAVGVQFVGFAL